MAVYTRVEPAALRTLLATYALGDLVACTGIEEGVENTNYLLETTLGRHILTIYERRVAAGDLPFFLGLMEHLAGRGLPCPLPVHDLEGRILRSLAGKPAAIVGFLDGRWPRRIEIEHCAALGRALALLHVAGEGFPRRRANALGPAGWRPLFAACGTLAGNVASGLEGEIAAELDTIAALWPDDLPAGVIHADLFPDNVFFAGTHLTGIIDFYFACDDLLAYDLAICLNAWCFEADISFNLTKATALLDAYRSVRPLGAAEIAAMPILARGAALRFLLTRLYDWLNRVGGALVRPKDPIEYLRKLRFHRAACGPEAYGLR